MKRLISRLRSKRGASMVEYGMILAIVVGAAILLGPTIKTMLTDNFGVISEKITTGVGGM